MLFRILIALTALQSLFGITGSETFGAENEAGPTAQPTDMRGAVESTEECRWTWKLASFGRTNPPSGFGWPDLYHFECDIDSTCLFAPIGDTLFARRLTDGQYIGNPVTLEKAIGPVTLCRRGILCGFSDYKDADIVLIDPLEYRLARRLKGHSLAPWRLVPSPDGARLLSCSDDHSIRLWDLGTGAEVGRFKGSGLTGHGAPRGEYAAFSPDGSVFATSCFGEINIYRTSDRQLIFNWAAFRLQGQPKSLKFLPEVLRFAPDGKSLFVFNGGMNLSEQTIAIVQLDFGRPGKLVRFFDRPGPSAAPRDGAFSPHGGWIVGWNGSSEISYWDIESRKQIKTLDVGGLVEHLAFSPTGEYFATAGADGATVWDLVKRRRIRGINQFVHEDAILVMFSPDGKTLVTGSDDGIVKVWDAPKCTRLPPVQPDPM